MSRKQRLEDTLSIELKPTLLLIEDESRGHQVPDGAETHFKVTAASIVFQNLNPVARHRLVNKLLANEFTLGLHALSLHLYTPMEWAQKTSKVPASPVCHHRKTSEG